MDSFHHKWVSHRDKKHFVLWTVELDYVKNVVVTRHKRHWSCALSAGPYGKGYPRGKKMAVRPFGGWPARRAYKGRAWRARLKL
jgi:hypothetical protein